MSTWDSVNNVNVTLSGADLVATTTTGSGENGVRTSPAKTSGLVYVEVAITAFAGVFYGFGIADSSWTYIDVASGDPHVFGWHAVNGGGSFVGLGTGVTGDVVAFEFNFTTKKAWASIFHSAAWSGWFGSAAGDPEAGTNGVDFSTLSGTDYFLAFAEPNFSGDIATVNFGGSAFAGGGNKTASYSAWDAGGGGGTQVDGSAGNLSNDVGVVRRSRILSPSSSFFRAS